LCDIKDILTVVVDILGNSLFSNARSRRIYLYSGGWNFLFFNYF